MSEEIKTIVDITLELSGSERLYAMSVKQGDRKTRFIRITLMKNQRVYTIPEGYTAIANILKPDKHFCYNECVIRDNKIVVELTNQALAAAGIAHCDVELRNEENREILSTQAFEVSIEKSMRNEKAIESCNEMTFLEQKVQKYINQMLETKKEVQDLSEAIKIEEAAREKAEEERQKQLVLMKKATADTEDATGEAQKQAQRASDEANNAKETAQKCENIVTDVKNRITQIELNEERVAEAVRSAGESASSANESANTSVLSATDAAQSEENARKYYEQAKEISESFVGALRPMGTVAFTNLPILESAANGDMYNISDEFTTTDDFKEGAGSVIPAGSNIYKTSDGKWDVLAGTPVTGVKGAKETKYRRGNVNLTPENIGAVATTGDASNTTNTFSKAATRINLISKEKLSVSLGKIMKWFADLKTVAFSGSYSDLADKPSTFPPSSHTHDDRYYTEKEIDDKLNGINEGLSNKIPTSASCNKNWNWSGQSGQPEWLWGSNDGANMYVYNPSNFSVNYATTADTVDGVHFHPYDATGAPNGHGYVYGFQGGSDLNAYVFPTTQMSVHFADYANLDNAGWSIHNTFDSLLNGTGLTSGVWGGTRARMWTDAEGGNFQWGNGKYYWQIDALSGDARVFCEHDGSVYFSMYWYQDGTGIQAARYDKISSKRYKENISNMTDEMAKQILQYRPVTYDYIDKSYGTECMGLIAEEVAAINKFPVHFKEEKPDSLDYSSFVPQLIKMVQIQQEQINAIKETLSKTYNDNEI